MLTIAVIGSPFASKVMQTLREQYGGEVHGDTVAKHMVEWRALVGDEQVAVMAVPDFASQDTVVRALGHADAMIFVVPRSPESFRLHGVPAWQALAGQLVAAGHASNFPTVILYGTHDDPRSLSISALDEALQIQSMMVAGDLQMPNPLALRYPARFDEPLPAFHAALRAAIDGPFKIDPAAKDTAMAILDAQIAEKMAAVPSKAEVVAQLGQLFATDPAFQDRIMKEVRAKAGRTLQTPNLRCPACKQELGEIELSSVTAGPFSLGSTLDLDLDALDPDGDWLAHEPEPGAPLIWLTEAVCGCDAMVWCRLLLRNNVLEEIRTTTFTRETFRTAHIVSVGGAVTECERQLGILPDPRLNLGTLRDLIENLN